MKQNDARRVLVVEDNPDTAVSLRMLLSMKGHDVRVAQTGPDAASRPCRRLRRARRPRSRRWPASRARA